MPLRADVHVDAAQDLQLAVAGFDASDFEQCLPLSERAVGASDLGFAFRPGQCVESRPARHGTACGDHSCGFSGLMHQMR